MRPSTGRFTFRTRVAAATLALHVAAPPSSLARADETSATELRARADAAMDQGAFAAAVAKYRASYKLSPSPALLYNIGNAYERLGDYPHALAYFERFAAVAPPDLKARVVRLDDLIDGVRGRLARVVVQCAVPGARVLVRGELQGTTPLADAIPAMPGEAHVEILADGYQPFAEDVALTAGKETRVDAVLVPEIATKSVPQRREEGASLTSEWWFWTGVGVIAAGGIATAIVVLAHPSSAPKGDIRRARSPHR